MTFEDQKFEYLVYMKEALLIKQSAFFFKVESRDANTLLNIIYNHVLPGTTIFSDCWAAYNRIIDLDRDYNHRTVNHSLTFVAPDGTHTNSIEST